jgi:uncharacterized protein (TIGR02996 family)
MNQEQAFREAIREAPSDDAPRLAYADWLDEQGVTAGAVHAEFIRVQVALARLPDDDPRRPGLERREQDLLEVHRDEWLAELPAWARQESCEFRRGFVGAASITAEQFLRGGEGSCTPRRWRRST